MPKKVEKIVNAYGIDIKGNMCEHYTCRRCGQKATACSYLCGKLVQVFVPHLGQCASYNDDNPYAANYSGTSNTCPTCRYEGPDSTCLYEDMQDDACNSEENSAILDKETGVSL